MGIRDFFKKVGRGIKKGAGKLWKAVKGVGGKIFKVAKGAGKVVSKIAPVAAPVLDSIMPGLGTGVSIASKFVDALPEGKAKSTLNNAVQKVSDTVNSKAPGVIDKVKQGIGVATDVADRINQSSGIGDLVKKSKGDIEHLANKAAPVLVAFSKKVTPVVGEASNAFQKLKQQMGNINLRPVTIPGPKPM